MPTKAKTTDKTPRPCRSTHARKRHGTLAPKGVRGLTADEIPLRTNAGEATSLANEIAAVGGTLIGAYRDPLNGRVLLLASLPLNAVEPTPFQRDLSPTHTKKLAQRIDETGVFLDPLIIVRGSAAKFFTPNGRHRLAAARMLGMQQIVGLISQDDALAYRILALNTEKAHNLKDKSLEVVRMAGTLAKLYPRRKEMECRAEFEAPELLTLGMMYERNARFGGVVSTLQSRGLKSPYLRNYVVARINPVRFIKATPGSGTPVMQISAALTRMAAAAAKFDVRTVSISDLRWMAAGAELEE